MVDLFDEVQEELREEKKFYLIKRYGSYLLGIMVVAIVFTAVYLWWNDYRQNQIFQVGGEFEKAYAKVITSNVEEGMKLFSELAKNNKTTYNDLALLNIAAYEDYQRNYEIAAQHYKAVMEHSDASGLLKDFARLMYLKSQMSLPKADKEKIILELQQFAESKQTFKSSTLELLAALQIKARKFSDAEQTIARLLSDPNTPHSMNVRAQEMAVLIQ